MVTRSGNALRHRGATLVVRAAVLVLLTAAVLCVTPRADAHAVLQGSTPAAASTLRRIPPMVTLRFDEAVTTVPSSLRVYGPGGQRVDRGGAFHPGGDGSRVGVALDHGDAQGTFLVSWRVVSDDSHPESGAFTFSVGHRSAAPTVTAEKNDPAVAFLLGASRWGTYLAVALLVGGVVFLLRCWPAGARDRVARRFITGGIVAVAATAVLGLLVKGSYDAGLGISGVGLSSLGEVLSTTFGRALVARLLVLVGVVLLLRRPTWHARAWRGSAAVLGVILVLSLSLTGHAAASSPRWLALLVDGAHVTAMACWTGGLLLLTLVVLPRRDSDVLEPAVERFSNLAAGSVVVLVATGSYQAYREVRAWAALTGTAYGRELLIKLGLVLVVLAAASASRAWLRRSRQGAAGDGRGPSLRGLRASVGLETLGVVAVLVVTSVLVTTEPAVTAYHPSVAANLALGPDTVQVSAVPAGDRRMTVHLYVFDAHGRPLQPKAVDATVSLPERSIGPLPLALRPAGVGHLIGSLTFPVAGTWQLAVTVRTTAIDELTRTVPVPVH